MFFWENFTTIYFSLKNTLYSYDPQKHLDPDMKSPYGLRKSSPQLLLGLLKCFDQVGRPPPPFIPILLIVPHLYLFFEVYQSSNMRAFECDQNMWKKPSSVWKSTFNSTRQPSSEATSPSTASPIIPVFQLTMYV